MAFTARVYCHQPSDEALDRFAAGVGAVPILPATLPAPLPTERAL